MRKTLVNPNYSAFNKDLTYEEISARKNNITTELCNDDLWLNDVSEKLGISYNDIKKRLNLFLLMIFLDKKYYMTLPALRKYFRNWVKYKNKNIEEPISRSHTAIFDSDHYTRDRSGELCEDIHKKKCKAESKHKVQEDEDFIRLRNHIISSLRNKITLNNNLDRFCLILLSIEDSITVIEEFDLFAGVYLSADELITPENFMRTMYEVLNSIRK